MKRLLLIWILFLTSLAYCQQPNGHTFLTFQYVGPQYKSPPSILLYVDSFDVTPWFYQIKLKLSKCEFVSVETVILENRLLTEKDTTGSPCYICTLFIKGKEIRPFTIKKIYLSQLFDQILSQITGNTKRKKLASAFNAILAMISDCS
jgi:hypothetical protein